MRRYPCAARLAVPVCGLFGLLAAGCMPIGYAFPTISYVRPASVGAARDEVKAFRVDVTDDDLCLEIPEKDRYVLTELPLHRDGSFDAQTKVAVDYGWLWNCVALICGSSRHHTLLVRLYRPGFQTIEIESWRKNGRMQWTPAPTLLEQEEALDALVSTWRTSPIRMQNDYALRGFVPPRDPIVFRYLAPGSIAPDHRDALQFAAGEYERLLSSAADAGLRQRLHDKAQTLWLLAAK
jgi:hypothetical protein